MGDVGYAIADVMEVNNNNMDSLSDSSDWSSSGDSDIDELLQGDDVEMMSLLVDVQAFEDRVKLMDQRRGSKMGRITIYRNRALGHEHLMQDYFTEVPTYPPRLFRRSRTLEKIIEQHSKRRRNEVLACATGFSLGALTFYLGAINLLDWGDE
ncbi:ATP-dependent zinc metalloprotease FTSH 5, mitochondrial [Hordeum vulgare]|nr:ATP-dependent zinc metalloprotease FTSH 5, mitochondrial [Hordeum vulgare]